jgi:hypothetical protein
MTGIRWPLLAGSLLAQLVGCSVNEPARIAVPDLSPSQAAKAAIAEFDSNGDGFLDEKELEKCPGLKKCWKDWDTNNDGRLSEDEIAAALQRYRDNKLGLVMVRCRVLLDGQPLEGATVTFVPEKFLGPGIKPASGVSDADGHVRLRTEGQDLPGVQCGIFRVVVSKKDSADQETISSRYNANTELGEEVGGEKRPGRGTFMLRSH